VSKKARKKREPRVIAVLGCNQRPQKSTKYEKIINVDCEAFEGVDIVADLNGKWPFEDGSLDEIRAHDLIEHLQDPCNTMNEAWRVLKNGGLFDILVPSTEGRGWAQDPTHVYNPQTKKPGSMWNQNSFGYYAVIPERVEDKDSPLVSHPWRALYPQLIKAAFMVHADTSQPTPDGIVYVAAKLIKVDAPEDAREPSRNKS